MKGLVFVFALLFVAVSAKYNGMTIELEENMLKCMINNYGKDPRDLSLDHNGSQILTCFFACDFSLKGAIHDNGTLNLTYIEELYAEEIATDDFPIVEVFSETYYGCKKDYPDHCDWFFCLDSRMPPETTIEMVVHSKNEKRAKDLKILKNDKKSTTLGDRIYQFFTSKNSPFVNKIN